MGVSLGHNMLARELAVVGLLVIVLIAFYFRYTAAAHKKYARTREHRMAIVVRSARRQLTVVAILLAGVVIYDRVLPHFGFGAPAVTETASSKPSVSSAKPADKKIPVKQKEAAAASAKATSASKKAASAALISQQKAAAASQSMIAASKAAASRTAQSAAASSQVAASAKASSNQTAEQATKRVDPKQKAVASAQQYLAQHPNDVFGRVDAVDVIDYSTDYNGVPAYQVGLYQTQADGSNVAVHMCFVYADGSVVQAY